MQVKVQPSVRSRGGFLFLPLPCYNIPISKKEARA